VVPLCAAPGRAVPRLRPRRTANPAEQIPLLLGYVSAALILLGVIDIFVISASTADAGPRATRFR